MSLLELPVELLHWIFNYLDIQTILYTVRSVCTQLDAVVKTYNRFSINFSLFCGSNSRPIPDFIEPKNIISLILANNDEIKPSQIDLFTSLFQPDQFTQLQSLALIEIHGALLDKFFQHMIIHPLLSFSITLRHQSATQTHSILDLLSSTIEQSGLRNLGLNISHAELLTDDRFPLVKKTLRHLTISGCTGQEYHQILCSCVHLRTFVVDKCLNRNWSVLTSPACKSYPQLTSLTLNECWHWIEELHSLLPMTSSLVHLKLTSEIPKWRYIRRLEGFVPTKLLLSKKFEFFFTHNPYVHKNSPSLESIYNLFKTPFSLDDKHSMFNCEYVLTSNQIRIYNIPIYTNKLEMIIRYDPLSSSNYGRIMPRHQIDHSKTIHTEQVCNNLTITALIIIFYILYRI
jgi:hypothetical protein